MEEADADSDADLSIPAERVPDLIHFLLRISTGKVRRAFRVPVTEGALDVWVMAGSDRVSLRPLHISLVGIGLAVTGDVPFIVGDAVAVEMKSSGKSAVITGIVRRREETELGIEFNDCYRDGNLAPPEALRQIIAPLEMQWLRARRENS
ncbi:MAG: hypothetical protein R3C49_18605 [Planctomycetaceae bacterium]